LPRARVTVSEPTAQSPEEYLLTSICSEPGGWQSGKYWTLLLDRQARVVWAIPGVEDALVVFAQVAASGDHVLWDESRYWSDFGTGAGSKVHATYLDREIEVIDTPGLHHPFVQLPDGTLVWGSQAHGGDEALVEKAPGQADETVLWTCLDDWPGVGGCESNGLFYRPETDTYLYSFYTNSTILEIERSTSQISWWAGEFPGGYTFTDPADQFNWQHGISWTPTGTLLMSANNDGDTQLMEYAVDHAAGALDLVWSSKSGVFVGSNGQAWRLANGNTLHLVGDTGVIREVGPSGADVWRVDYDSMRLLGHGQLVADLYALVSPTP
ncbi:MAG: hypothetical protein ABMA64_36480, partial [Myxococcota bacterium]